MCGQLLGRQLLRMFGDGLVLGVQSLFLLCCLLTIRDSYEQLCAGQGDASGKVNQSESAPSPSQ